MVLARFLPKDEKFFSFFNDAADNAAEAARVLVDIVESGAGTQQKVQQLRDLEHQGDEISHRIFDALNSTFVTPLDRDDIRSLTTSIDDFVDGLEEAGQRLWLYRLGASTVAAKHFARILHDQGALIAHVMPLIERTPANADEIRRSAEELHRLENEGDEALTTVLASLYEGVTEVPALIQSLRWGELYQLFEDATDRGEDVADTLQGILLKYA